MTPLNTELLPKKWTQTLFLKFAFFQKSDVVFCYDFLFCCVIFSGNVHLEGVLSCESVLTLEDASQFGVVLLFPLCFPE